MGTVYSPAVATIQTLMKINLKIIIYVYIYIKKECVLMCCLSNLALNLK